MKNAYGFYLLGPRAYRVLQEFVTREGADSVAWVVYGEDRAVENDFHREIIDFCHCRKIHTVARLESRSPPRPASLSFAVGWRWLIQDGNHERLVVFHDSLLPKYRGFAPLVNALISGEDQVGVSAIWAADQYDTGELLAQASVPISYPMKISSAIEITSELYVNLVFDIVDRMKNAVPLSGTRQIEANASYSLWRDEDDYAIDWRRPSFYIKRFIDAVGSPYRGACTLWGQRRIRVVDAEVYGDLRVEDRESHVGKIVLKIEEDPVIVCGEGLLRLISLVDDESGDSVLLPFRTRLR